MNTDQPIAVRENYNAQNQYYPLHMTKAERIKELKAIEDEISRRQALTEKAHLHQHHLHEVYAGLSAISIVVVAFLLYVGFKKNKALTLRIAKYIGFGALMIFFCMIQSPLFLFIDENYKALWFLLGCFTVGASLRIARRYALRACSTAEISNKVFQNGK